MSKGPTASDPAWYKDAVVYELKVRTFCDSNGDGIGDFRGLTDKLGYLEYLGVTCLWLLPFYKSPWRDDGYDIAHYERIHPACGTMRDFTVFLDRAHARGMRVITELVLNHTSDRHPWFEATFTSGAIAPIGTPAHASFSATWRSPTGPGIPWPAHSTGTGSSTISRT